MKSRQTNNRSKINSYGSLIPHLIVGNLAEKGGTEVKGRIHAFHAKMRVCEYYLMDMFQWQIFRKSAVFLPKLDNVVGQMPKFA